MRKVLFAAIVGFSSMLVTTWVHAGLIIGNLPSNDGGDVFTLEQSAAYSIGFKTGTNAFTITSVDMRLRSQGTAGSVSLQLRSDDGSIQSNPSNTSVLNFSNQTVAVSATFALYSFAPIGSPQLLANTTYWLTVGTDHSGSGNGLIVPSNNPAKTPVGPHAQIVGLRTGFPNDQTNDITGTFPYPSFEVNGDVVATPEPSTGLLVVSALIMAGARQWRRRKNGLPLFGNSRHSNN